MFQNKIRFTQILSKINEKISHDWEYFAFIIIVLKTLFFPPLQLPVFPHLCGHVL